MAFIVALLAPVTAGLALLPFLEHARSTGILLLTLFTVIIALSVVGRAFSWIAKTPEMSLLGALGAIAVMFLINPWAGVGAVGEGQRAIAGWQALSAA